MVASTALRSALFVDFDNIFLGLRKAGSGTEERFAQDPSRWVRWLEEEFIVPYAGESGEPSRRRILLRRCYLNPRAFYRSRPFFIRAGFEVVDTPPLTMQGKTSADMLMALDMVDALGHATRFDEFIVFSGDADFTPVLLRVRAHDRRTAVLSTGASSAAYRSACDYVIEEDLFVEKALGALEAEAGARAVSVAAPSSTVRSDLLRRIGDRVRAIAATTGGIQANQLPQVYKEFREFVESGSWLGFGSLRTMTEAIVEAHDGLELIDEEPWWIGAVDVGDGVGEAGEGPIDLAAVTAAVEEIVGASDRPIDLATLANHLLERFGGGLRAHGWQGTGSFKMLLERLPLEQVEISSVMPGYAFVPGLHPDPTDEDAVDTFAVRHPKLAGLAKNVHDLTDMPYLAPSDYATVFREIASEIQENGFHLTQTSKAVRDRCFGKGMVISRGAVSFLLKGLLYSGFPLGSKDHATVAEISENIYENALVLCERAQMEVSPEQEEGIREWILGGVSAEEAAPPADSPAVDSREPSEREPHASVSEAGAD